MVTLKRTLRLKYNKIKIHALRKNDYHSGLQKQLESLLSMKKLFEKQLMIASYIPKIQKQIIPPYIQNNLLRYSFPYFTKQNRSMTFHEYFVQSGWEMYKSDSKSMGIKIIDQKYKQNTKIQNVNIVLVPLNAFDKNSKHRIGYGGGYYDNFISLQRQNNNQQVLFVGVGLQCLIIDINDINQEDIFGNHDQPLDYIITENRIY